MTEKQDIEILMKAVLEMRSAQAAYFKSRNNTNLQNSKGKEQRVDDLLHAFIKKGYVPQVQVVEQPVLFQEAQPPRGIMRLGKEDNGITYKDYSAFVKPFLDGPRTELWTAMKDFITDKRPTFIEPFVDIWNVFVRNYKLSIPQVEKATEKRKQKFAVRIKDPDFDFVKILQGIHKSETLKGNGTGWAGATFDFCIENDTNYIKIIEGAYK